MVMGQVAFAEHIHILLVIPGRVVQPVCGIKMFLPEN
jgi:hypothetical protein